MTVYVDSARHRLGRMFMSHVVADTLEELHVAVGQAGVQRRWFQNGDKPHYDVCQQVRDTLIKRGALIVSSKEIVRRAKLLAAQ